MTSDSTGCIYITRPTHKRRFVSTIVPSNPKIAVIYESGVETSDLVSSLRIIIKDFQHRAKLEADIDDSHA